MRRVVLAVVLLVGGTGWAQATCTDDIKDLNTRLEARERFEKSQIAADPVRQQQTVAARKELTKAQKSDKDFAELDCLNAVTRARRALNTPPPKP